MRDSIHPANSYLLSSIMPPPAVPESGLGNVCFATWCKLNTFMKLALPVMCHAHVARTEAALDGCNDHGCAVPQPTSLLTLPGRPQMAMWAHRSLGRLRISSLAVFGAASINSPRHCSRRHQCEGTAAVVWGHCLCVWTAHDGQPSASNAGSRPGF